MTKEKRLFDMSITCKMCMEIAKMLKEDGNYAEATALESKAVAKLKEIIDAINVKTVTEEA